MSVLILCKFYVLDKRKWYKISLDEFTSLFISKQTLWKGRLSIWITIQHAYRRGEVFLKQIFQKEEQEEKDRIEKETLERIELLHQQGSAKYFDKTFC